MSPQTSTVVFPTLAMEREHRSLGTGSVSTKEFQQCLWEGLGRLVEREHARGKCTSFFSVIGAWSTARRKNRENTKHETKASLHSAASSITHERLSWRMVGLMPGSHISRVEEHSRHIPACMPYNFGCFSRLSWRALLLYLCMPLGSDASSSPGVLQQITYTPGAHQACFVLLVVYVRALTWSRFTAVWGSTCTISLPVCPTTLAVYRVYLGVLYCCTCVCPLEVLYPHPQESCSKAYTHLKLTKRALRASLCTFARSIGRALPPSHCPTFDLGCRAALWFIRRRFRRNKGRVHACRRSVEGLSLIHI